MIVVTALGWFIFAALVLLAHAAGAAAARLVPLAPTATSSVRRAIGGALAPFLLGFATIAALACLPGAPRWLHLGVVAALLAIVAFAGRRLRSAHQVDAVIPTAPFDTWDVVLTVLLAAFAVLLIVHAIAIPLTQSDALEYATAARRLFHLPRLSAYPPLDPVGDPSGFYGPWTHPPLYVSLEYIASASQGNANSPALIRLLAPWALLAAARLVYVLGATHSRRVGLLAALFLVGTPALFLGAESAQIDALTVLGLSLAATAVVFASQDNKGAIAVGVLNGVAAWAHSQAILVTPMIVCAMFALGSGNLRSRWRATGLACVAAVLVGAWPYLWNFVRLGVVISDNPAVYALPQLDWAGYFRSERDLVSAAARVQYGILKGWTAPDAFGLSFWIMAVGVTVVARRLRLLALRRAQLDAPDRMDVAVLAVLGCYFAGVVTSTAAGIDLMIKNERYYMIIMPAVALLAARGATQLVSLVSGRRFVAQAGMAMLAFMFAAEIPVLFAYRAARMRLTVSDLGLPLDAKLARWEPFGAIRALRESTTSGAVLALKPADMYYTGHKMVSYLDPRLLDVYQATDAVTAAARLRAIGVSRVQVPSYGTPPLYNSPLLAVLADPAITTLDASAGGYQVYTLRADSVPPRQRYCDQRAIGPANAAWTWHSRLVFGGVKQLAAFSRGAGSVHPGIPPQPHSALFQRERSTTLESPTLPLLSPSPRELGIELTVTGHGSAHVFVQQVRADGTAAVREELGGTLLTADHSERTYMRRLLVDPATSAVRVLVEYNGQASIGVSAAMLSAVCTDRGQLFAQPAARRPAKSPDRL